MIEQRRFELFASAFKKRMTGYKVSYGRITEINGESVNIYTLIATPEDAIPSGRVDPMTGKDILLGSLYIQDEDIEGLKKKIDYLYKLLNK